MICRYYFFKPFESILSISDKIVTWHRNIILWARSEIEGGVIKEQDLSRVDLDRDVVVASIYCHDLACVIGSSHDPFSYIDVFVPHIDVRQILFTNSRVDDIDFYYAPGPFSYDISNPGRGNFSLGADTRSDYFWWMVSLVIFWFFGFITFEHFILSTGFYGIHQMNFNGIASSRMDKREGVHNISPDHLGVVMVGYDGLFFFQVIPS